MKWAISKIPQSERLFFWEKGMLYENAPLQYVYKDIFNKRKFPNKKLEMNPFSGLALKTQRNFGAFLRGKNIIQMIKVTLT